MKILPDWLVSALSDGATPPATSMTRLLAFITVLAVIVGPSLVIAELSLCGGKPVPMPEGWTAFMGAACTAVMALFACNKRSE